MWNKSRSDAADGAGIDHGVEVDEALPVLTAVNHHQNLLGQLLGLGQGQNFKKLVQSAEAAGKDHQGLGQIGEPELAHEEVMELKIKRRRDVGIRVLFEGQIDVEADGFPARLLGSQVGGFHDAGAASGGHDEAPAAGWNLD